MEVEKRKWFYKGQKINHFKKKTITESDNNLFCLMTMNHHPVHLDVEFAKTSYHNKILVVGPLIISLSIGIASQDIDKYSLFCKSFDFMKHTEPVFLGDTIEVKSEILEKFEENGISYIKVQSKTLNQNNRCVLDLIRTLAFEKERGDNDE